MPRCWITKPEQLNLQLPMLFIEHCPAQVWGCSISGVLVPTEGRDVALLVDLISRPFVPTYLHPSHPNPHRLIWNKSVLLWWMQCSAPYWANRSRVAQSGSERPPEWFALKMYSSLSPKLLPCPICNVQLIPLTSPPDSSFSSLHAIWQSELFHQPLPNSAMFKES